jgi:hypothetical protein
MDGAPARGGRAIRDHSCTWNTRLPDATRGAGPTGAARGGRVQEAGNRLDAPRFGKRTNLRALAGRVSNPERTWRGFSGAVPMALLHCAIRLVRSARHAPLGAAPAAATSPSSEPAPRVSVFTRGREESSGQNCLESRGRRVARFRRTRRLTGRRRREHRDRFFEPPWKGRCEQGRSPSHCSSSLVKVALFKALMRPVSPQDQQQNRVAFENRS